MTKYNQYARHLGLALLRTAIRGLNLNQRPTLIFSLDRKAKGDQAWNRTEPNSDFFLSSVSDAQRDPVRTTQRLGEMNETQQHVTVY